jgi:hypothetical protein
VLTERRVRAFSRQCPSTWGGCFQLQGSELKTWAECNKMTAKSYLRFQNLIVGNSEPAITAGNLRDVMTNWTFPKN